MRRCWDTLDVVSLGLIAGGLVVRSTDGANLWGRALYAMSAPILFARLLFFAQFLRVCGPTIQVRALAYVVTFGERLCSETPRDPASQLRIFRVFWICMLVNIPWQF